MEVLLKVVGAILALVGFIALLLAGLTHGYNRSYNPDYDADGVGFFVKMGAIGGLMLVVGFWMMFVANAP